MFKNVYVIISRHSYKGL